MTKVKEEKKSPAKTTKAEIAQKKAEAKDPMLMQEHMITLPLDGNLKAEIADHLLNIQIDIDAQQEKKAEFDERKKQESLVFSDELRSLNQQFEEVFLSLKQGKITKSVRCSKIKDPDNNTVNFYDENKQLIHSQEMTVEDQQFSIEDKFEQ